MAIKNIEGLVLETLEENQRARKDDFVLYGGVLKRMGIDLRQSLAVFLANAKVDCMPSFETVSRARRKIQEERKDLVDYETEEKRREAEQDFILYSRTTIKEDN